jgi:hypothetical protein
MKTIQYFFFAATALLFVSTGCSNKDSEFYNDIFVSVPNLVNANYDSGTNVLYVTADISRYLNEPNQTNLLDIYKSTGGASRLDFSYVIEKQIDAANWSIYEVLDSQIEQVRGEALSGGPYVFATSVYKASNQVYEFRAGIHSLPAGNYRLSFGYNSTSATDVELRSESEGNQLFLNLNSPYSGLDSGGYQHFTVL